LYHCGVIADDDVSLKGFLSRNKFFFVTAKNKEKVSSREMNIWRKRKEKGFIFRGKKKGRHSIKTYKRKSLRFVLTFINPPVLLDILSVAKLTDGFGV